MAAKRQQNVTQASFASLRRALVPDFSNEVAIHDSLG
jgi:hypothetical protein